MASRSASVRRCSFCASEVTNRPETILAVISFEEVDVSSVAQATHKAESVNEKTAASDSSKMTFSSSTVSPRHASDRQSELTIARKTFNSCTTNQSLVFKPQQGPRSG